MEEIDRLKLLILFLEFLELGNGESGETSDRFTLGFERSSVWEL